MASLGIRVVVYKTLRILVSLYLLILTIGHYFIHEYVYACLILVMLVVYTNLNIRSFASAQFGTLATQLVWLCFLTFQSYKNYSKYEDGKILIHYSKDFNHRRKQLGVPIIPAWWHVFDKGTRDIEWRGNEHSIGHVDKLIIVDSNRMIEFESDDYTLKPIGKSERHIYVRYIYETRKHPDTLGFTYAIGDSSKNISKAVASDTLNANHIQKDY